MLLGQLLMEANHITRKEVKRLLKDGSIQVNHQVTQDYAKVVDPAWMAITIDGVPLESDMGHTYYIAHKPQGYVSANKDAQYPTVLDLIEPKDNPGNLAISGRLDRDAHGLVFLTNNGQLHYILQQPKFDIEKTYRVTVNGLMDGQMIAAFQEGIVFDDGTVCKPAALDILTASEQTSTGIVRISQGQRHQIKKMFLACGVKVTDLFRQKIGPMDLGELPEGAYRPLNETEKLAIMNLFLLYNRRND
ncbi:pseudouridine synthase [Aerococcus sp. 1KP-2016]|uniref:pseudouridine synthase n=1 Tax=Aerococcus sp. 1KP-2016 TaxID=1981982 RepID=UPI000B9918EB|nr:pseudouridine synthase [Aerococcus sp. 1KP-2016]OYQ66653.1 ribosomal small subunit pseudouridine synthase A [Aerococcus sp. 1KP-2016]